MLRGRHRQSVENVTADEQATPTEQELWPPVTGAGGQRQARAVLQVGDSTVSL
jgi:hypothetical protein